MPRLPSIAIGVALVAVFVVASSSTAAPPSTSQPQGLRDQRVERHLLKGARVIVAPGTTLEGADVLVESGRIVAVGGDLVAPPGAETHDLTGKTIYAGLIDAYAETPIDSETPSPYWNSAVRPERRATLGFSESDEAAKKLREQGFVARLYAPAGGVLKGTSCLASLGDAPRAQALIAEDVFQHIRLTAERRAAGYPSSPMGAVALARQAMHDADWHVAAKQVASRDPALTPPERNDALSALAHWREARRPFLADGLDEQYFLRADAFAREFELDLVVLGSGREYRRLDAIVAAKRPIILPVAFPAPPDVTTLEGVESATLAELMHWDHAPENPARLVQAGTTICFTSAGLKDLDEYLKQLRRAVARGLPPDAALAALTTEPARLLGAVDELGRVAPGVRASFFVTDGDLFAEKTKVVETWVDGKRFEIEEKPSLDAAGGWKVSHAGGERFASFSLQVAGKADKPNARLFAWPGKTDEDEAPQVEKVEWSSPALSLRFAGERWKRPGDAFLSLVYIPAGEGDATLSGRIVWADGSASIVKATKTDPPAEPSKEVPTGNDADEKQASDEESEAAEGADAAKQPDEETPDDGVKSEESDDEKSDQPAVDFDPAASFPILYPFRAFGREAPPEQPALVLFENATVWTCGEAGTLDEADVLIGAGKILAVGVDLKAPQGTFVVDASGMHLTPGLIDCHSHIATDGGVNEASQAITAEVRVGDFVDADEPAIYEQLAGGVTVVNVLHGSANPIGGQNQVIKLRWGALPEELKFVEAPAGIKFALGENVKQSNWDERTGRYPQSRMGVPEIMADAFEGARAYRRAQAEFRRTGRGLPVRVDLEMEAIAEVLEGKRWIHCHSYRQDEILAFLRTLDAFDVTVGTLQHILEGYKMADVLAEHGATGSSFSDWWAYKVEVWDAIPHNGALMHRAGVCVSFNSDDRELARRLNVEAAKAMKYGGVPEEEALKFVTLNPAKQLRIDAFVGSIEPDKHADLALWNGPPLSAFSRCEQTWVDGRKYFDRAEDAKEREIVRSRKAALVAKVLKSGQKPRKPGEEDENAADGWDRYDRFCGHDHGDHDHGEHDHERSFHAEEEAQR